MFGILNRNSSQASDSGVPHAAHLTQMLDKLSEIVMLCDTSHENRIFYMNRSAREAITQCYRQQLNAGLRGADAADAMGSPMHLYHSHPERLRQALARPDKLPHQDELSVGESTFQTTIHAIWDDAEPGKVACYMICWTDITAIKQQQQALAELERKRQLEDRIQQIAAAVEQMSATVAEVAGNTHEAAQNSDQVAHTALEGQQIVNQALEGMLQVAEMVRNASEAVQRLGRQSAQINAIANVIDGIADQTNMLALNAAIEAARAGDQGRGFAVVADEVRKLAERTAEATGEIGRVIKLVQQDTHAVVQTMDAGQQHVARGEELSRKAEAALGRIVRDIESVNSMIAHIASATHQQAATSQEIARNLDEVSKL